MTKPTSRELLEKAAAALDHVAADLADVHCTIDGQLARLDVGTEWEAHPEIPCTELRRWPAPAGAPYQLLEVRSQAGAQAEHVQMSHAADVHVLAGLVAIGRAGASEPEYHAAGTCYQVAVSERHSFNVLQDTHNLVVVHFHS